MTVPYTMIGVDDVSPPPPQRQLSCFQRWQGRVVTFVGAGAFAALRAVNLHPIANAIGCLGAGYFAQRSISIGFSGSALAKVRQVSMTLMGQVPLFCLSQIFTNTGNFVLRSVIDSVIIASLGANIEIISSWLFDQGAVRVESHLHPVPRSYNAAQGCIFVFKCASAIFFGYSLMLATDPVALGLSAFGAAYFAAHAFAEGITWQINREIALRDTGQGTWIRTLKVGLTTLAHIGIPLCFIPWTANPDTAERQKQLGIVGGLIGVLDGVLSESVKDRVRNVPLEQLAELKKLDGERSRFQKVWDVAVPALSLAAILGITVWQEMALDNQNSRIAIGTMAAGFVASYGGAKWADWKWNPEVRGFWKDRLMTFFSMDPRIFGINPLFLYLAGTNALKMDNREIEAGESSLKLATIIVAWGCYGIAMGRELYATTCNRVGSITAKFPMMAISNQALTTKLSLTGVIP